MSDTHQATATTRHLPFDVRQTAILIGVGIVLWFVAAVLLRVLGPMGIYEGSGRIALYTLIIPGTVPFVPLVRRLAGIGRDQIALGVSIAMMDAMFCDGIALAWFPELYGSSAEHTAGAGAAILWGAAVAIGLGVLFNRSEA